MKNKWLFLFIMISVFAGGCSTQKSSVYRYYYKQPIGVASEKPVKIFVAPLNIMVSKKDVLGESYQVVNSYLDGYLKSSDYDVLPQKYFMQAWMISLEEVGGILNPLTAKFSQDRFQECLNLTIQKLSERHQFSYVVFPDLVVKSIKLNKNSDLAEWDGVTRTLPSKGFFRFNWKRAPGASLVITVFSKNGELCFLSKGGLDFLVASTRQGRVFSLEPRENPFENEENLAEGVRLSLYPFVYYDEYPSS